MSTLVHDQNGDSTMVKNGHGAGGLFTLSNGNWRRLMPSNNNGVVHPTETSRFSIGSLPDGILDVADWNLKILKPGYEQKHNVRLHDGNYLILDRPIDGYEALKAIGGTEYVLFPKVVVPISITNLEGGNNKDIDIGLIKDDKYITPAASVSDIVLRAIVKNDKNYTIYFSGVDKIFVKREGNQNVQVCWGEHRIENA